MADMIGRRFDKYVFRVGSSWKDPPIDEKLVAGYRFDPSGYARLKLSMDVAAGFYLAMAFVAVLIAVASRGFSVSGIFILIGQGLTLQPLLNRLLASNTQPDSVGWSEVLVFGMLVVALLFHESRWLKRKIHYQALVSGRAYHGFLGGVKKPTLEKKRQRTVTILSSTVNHLFLLCVVLIAASLLWDMRNLSRLGNPAVLSRVVLAGMLLMVIGAFEMIKVLESEGATRLMITLNALIGAVLSGILFGVTIAVGLNRGTEQGKRAFVFGFGLALSASAWRHFVARPRGEPSNRLKRVVKYLVHTPLIALGRLLDLVLRVLLVVASVPQRILARLALILLLFRPLLPYSLRIGLQSIAYAESYKRFNERSASERPFIETVSTGDGYSVGYLHRPPPVLRGSGFIEIIQSRLLRMLLEEDTWLTRWVKREPIRALRTRHGVGWEREDPLDFAGRVRSVFGTRPQPSEAYMLYRRLLALMLAVWLVACIFDFLVGHIVSFYGRSLFEKGISYAAFLGLAVGAFFAIVTAFGQASLGVLTLGLMSGLSLDPTLGLGSGLKYQIQHDGVIYAFTFVVMSMSSTLEKRGLLVMGLIVFAIGLYLQFLPYLIRN